MENAAQSQYTAARSLARSFFWGQLQWDVSEPWLILESCKGFSQLDRQQLQEPILNELLSGLILVTDQRSPGPVSVPVTKIIVGYNVQKVGN